MMVLFTNETFTNESLQNICCIIENVSSLSYAKSLANYNTATAEHYKVETRHNHVHKRISLCHLHQNNGTLPSTYGQQCKWTLHK